MKKENEFTYAKIPRPTAKLSRIKDVGIVKIEFDQDMKVLPDLLMLKHGKFEIDGYMHSVFDVELIPGETSDMSNLQFDWSVTEMTQRYIQIQLLFKQARFVSMEAEPEFLKVTLRDNQLFISKRNKPVAKIET